MEKKIAIIGGGNLGGAIALGLIASQMVAPEDIFVTRRRISLLDKLKEQGVRVGTDNNEAVKTAEIIFIVVKPYQVISVLEEIRGELNENKLIISLVAGVDLPALEEAVGPEVPVFRAMPNTAISIRESMTCVSTNCKSDDLRNEVMNLFDQMGKTVLISDELMAAATVLASCGIAFALRYIRAAMQGGIEIGFGAEMAQFITAQTVKGATGLILDSGHHPEREIDKVTTPRGVTITGLNEMEHKGFSSSLIQGLVSSYNKIGNR